MENIERLGNIFKKTREEKGISIDTIAEKTKISKKFITSIEESDFSSFPADIYLYGFIANISDVLGLKSDEMVEKFKQEQQANDYRTKYSPEMEGPEDADIKQEEATMKDLESLDDNPHTGSILSNKKIMLPLLIVLAVAAFSFITWKFIIESGGPDRINPDDNTITEVKEYKMIKQKESFDLQKGDVIKLFINNTAHIFTLQNIMGESTSFQVNNDEHSLSQGENLAIDLNGDNAKDVDIKLKIISGDIAIFQLTLQGQSTGKVDYQSIWDNQEHIIISEEDYTLFAQQEKFPITVYIKAVSQSSFLQYNVDGQRQNSSTLSPGQDEEIEADDHLEIQIGNYRSDIIIINKHPITITSESESFQTTKIIKWIPDPENESKFDLVIKDSYN